MSGPAARPSRRGDHPAVRSESWQRQVAAHLTAFCDRHRVPPRAVRARVADFQAELTAAGVELRWPRVEAY